MRTRHPRETSAKQIRHGRACPGHPCRWAVGTSGYLHDFAKRHCAVVAKLFRSKVGRTWMAWTSPAMTAATSIARHRLVDLIGPGFDAAVEIDGIVEAGISQKVDDHLAA